MPNFNQILEEHGRLVAEGTPNALDVQRRSYLRRVSELTGRNTIAYYSGWLTKPPGQQNIDICDDDKNGFMATIYGLDRKKGLDLMMHTPGGDIAATESLVNYLRKMFGIDIRVIVPQIAMSAGTMIACAAKQIIMGKHSNLGPIDPQVNGVAAAGVLDEFSDAVNAVKSDPAAASIWQAIIGKYHPTFLGSCQRAINMSRQIVTEWLRTGMFDGDPDAVAKAKAIVEAFSDHQATKSHARHIHMEECQRLGMKVQELESDPVLQEAILSVHHAAMFTLTATPSFKFIENQNGQAYFRILQAPPPANA